MIGFLVQGRVRIRIRVRDGVGVTFNVSVYHWSTCHRSKCRTHTFSDIHAMLQALSHNIFKRRNNND